MNSRLRATEDVLAGILDSRGGVAGGGLVGSSLGWRFLFLRGGDSAFTAIRAAARCSAMNRGPAHTFGGDRGPARHGAENVPTTAGAWGAIPLPGPRGRARWPRSPHRRRSGDGVVGLVVGRIYGGGPTGAPWPWPRPADARPAFADPLNLSVREQRGSRVHRDCEVWFPSATRN